MEPKKDMIDYLPLSDLATTTTTARGEARTAVQMWGLEHLLSSPLLSSPRQAQDPSHKSRANRTRLLAMGRYL
jgi:hypothetical protein